MPNVEIGRYENPEETGFKGWIKCDGFHIFVGLDGKPIVWFDGDFS